MELNDKTRKAIRTICETTASERDRLRDVLTRQGGEGFLPFLDHMLNATVQKDQPTMDIPPVNNNAIVTFQPIYTKERAMVQQIIAMDKRFFEHKARLKQLESLPTISQESCDKVQMIWRMENEMKPAILRARSLLVEAETKFSQFYPRKSCLKDPEFIATLMGGDTSEVDRYLGARKGKELQTTGKNSTAVDLTPTNMQIEEHILATYCKNLGLPEEFGQATESAMTQLYPNMMGILLEDLDELIKRGQRKCE